MPFAATWIDLEVVILSETSQIEKEKYVICHLHAVLKSDINEFIYKTETDSQRTSLWLPRQKGWEEG